MQLAVLQGEVLNEATVCSENIVPLFAVRAYAAGKDTEILATPVVVSPAFITFIRKPDQIPILSTSPTLAATCAGWTRHSSSIPCPSHQCRKAPAASTYAASVVFVADVDGERGSTKRSVPMPQRSRQEPRAGKLEPER